MGFWLEEMDRVECVSEAMRNWKMMWDGHFVNNNKI